MAQPQPQYSAPQRPFSPPQNAASPTAPQQFGLPPNKRQRLSPNPSSQPGSPYLQSPYGMSPSTSAPPSTGASPHFANVQLPQGVYNTPYSNGHTTPTLTLPQSQPSQQSQPNQQPHFPSSVNFTNGPHTFPRPDFASYTTGQASPQPQYNQNQNQFLGTMGPPSKPVDKPKEDGVDVMDVLGGTGVDLREEEQYTFNLSKSFNSHHSGSQSGTISSGHSFTQFPPGDEASFYGAGPANTAAEKVQTKSQEDYIKQVADKAWADAAWNLAQSRQNELKHPFLQVQVIQAKMQKISRENGLSLNVDKNGMMGTMRLPENFPNREVRAHTAMGPDSGFVATNGSFLPVDTMLVDQVALMSIATKHRLRGLLEDAVKLAKGRQTGSHGFIPEEWSDVAAPSSLDSLVIDGGPRNGWESAVSPHSTPLNRSLSNANKLPTPVSDSAKTPTTAPKVTNEVVAAMRASAIRERDQEEARLRKRLARAAGEGPASRQNSIIPGTPGSIAPESIDKAPTKKEQKKKAEAKVNEAANHAAANTTTAQFLGGGGGLFGKKKKYSWMSAAGGGSGASTPGRINTQGLPGTPGGGLVNILPEKLTVDGVRRLGQWRDDQAKGLGVQIRDWVSVLEQDGREKKALQKAYMNLDYSEPK